MTEEFSIYIKNNKQLPKDWIWSSLEKVADVIAGNPAPQGELFFENGTYPFVRVQDMGRLRSQKFLNKTNDYINDKAIEKLKLIPKGSVLFTKSGASTLLNQRAVLGSDMYVVSHIAAAIPHDDIISDWLYYWLKTVDFNYIAHATTLPSLPLSKARGIPVPIAPINEQEQIVAEIEKQFSRLDKAVDNLKRIRANLKRYKASVLKSAVEGKLTEEWRKANPDVEPADKLLKRILAERRKKWEEAELAKMKVKGKAPKDDKWKKRYKEPEKPDIENLSDIPDSWLWAKLESVTEIKGGITKDSKRVVATPKKLPYLRVANVQRGYLDLDKIKYINVPSKKLPDFLLEKGDILFNEGGDRDKLGRGWIWEGQIDQCTYQNHVFRARLYLNKINGKWFSWFGNTFGQQYFMAKGKQTTNLASINKTMLSAFPIPLPPIKEQFQLIKEIEKYFSIVSMVEKEVEQNLLRAEHLRQSILKKAFSGKLI